VWQYEVASLVKMMGASMDVSEGEAKAVVIRGECRYLEGSTRSPAGEQTPVVTKRKALFIGTLQRYYGGDSRIPGFTYSLGFIVGLNISGHQTK
jgi:hypothetical protein